MYIFILIEGIYYEGENILGVFNDVNLLTSYYRKYIELSKPIKNLTYFEVKKFKINSANYYTDNYEVYNIEELL